MNAIFKRLIVAVAALLCLWTPAVASAAFNPLDSACQSDPAAKTSAACGIDNSKDPLTGPHGVLKRITLLLGLIAGIAAVIILILSGFRYIISNGDAQKAASARSSALGAVIGLVIIIASTSIIVFVVGKL
ncbi:MAG TPA: hypothetical protein VLF40_02305 [Candidatus Saccharimonadales bacterium]|nr:hypothetical protein [Candidatus Saccharimonadales bacterium]